MGTAARDNYNCEYVELSAQSEQQLQEEAQYYLDRDFSIRERGNHNPKFYTVVLYRERA
jgi:hypothetical protein